MGFLEEGFDVVGIDILPMPTYPSTFMQTSIVGLPGSLFTSATAIVSSPPCKEFSRTGMPWLVNVSEPDLTLVREVLRIRKEAGGIPLILENSRFAQSWLGKAKGHYGPFYLWGAVPLPLPSYYPHEHRKKESYGSNQELERAKIPIQLSRYIAKHFKESQC